MPKGPLRLIVTASGGTVTIAGKGAGTNAPSIAPGVLAQKTRSTVTAVP